MMALPDNQASIAALIPHQGDMCLLERVLECTPDHIVCTSRSHLQLTHPLREQGRLSAVHLCEYGAQAVALHGALTHSVNSGRARPGMLVALRDVKLMVDTLDQCAECNQHDLQVRAAQIHASDTGCMYDFEVSVQSTDIMLAAGKVTIMNGSAS